MEEDLVASAREGDRAAIGALYTRHTPAIKGYLGRLLGNPTEAEDATQQVFVKAFENIVSYEQRGRPFAAWLFRLARNHGLDELRKRRRRQEFASSTRSEFHYRIGHNGEPHPWLGDDELRALVRGLPQSQQKVLFLRYAAGFSSNEAAGVLKVSPAAVRQQQKRAIASLQAAFTSVER